MRPCCCNMPRLNHIPMIPSWFAGEWAGLCKIDKDGQPRKVTNKQCCPLHNQHSSVARTCETIRLPEESPGGMCCRRWWVQALLPSQSLVMKRARIGLHQEETVVSVSGTSSISDPWRHTTTS
eukprot:3375866-Amphidinium_carterae.1